MNESNFDVIVWGASGFTGRLVAEYLHKTYGEAESLHWAMAGRNKRKLQQVRQDIAGDRSSQIPIILADSNDEDALTEMVARTRVVCSTVGPYARYGTALVDVCAKSGTHYCDLTGEVHWMRQMIEQHLTQAEESGAKIVHTCGFDSIPSDLGVHFLQKEMQKKHGCFASSINCRVVKTRGGLSGGTVDSLMSMMEEARRNTSIMDILADPYALNPLNMPRGDDVNDQTGVKYDEHFKQWTAPFIMAGINTRVVRRSHALLGYPYGRGFRYDESMLMGDGPGGFVRATLVSGGSTLLLLAAAFGPSRSMLRQVAPSPGEGPSKEAIANGFFEIELLAHHPQEKNKYLKALISGDRDPGYGATSKMLAESAVCLAKDDLDEKGGVTTPAVAMGHKLISRLQAKAGMTFQIR